MKKESHVILKMEIITTRLGLIYTLLVDFVTLFR